MRKPHETMQASEQENLFSLHSEITRAIIATVPLEGVLEIVARGVVTHLGYQVALVGLYRPEENCFSLAALYPQDELLHQAMEAVDRDPCQLKFPLDPQTNPGHECLLRGEPWVSADLGDFVHPLLPTPIAHAIQHLYGTRCTISMPMWIRNHLVGTILTASEASEITSEEQEALVLVARQAAVAVENDHLLATEKQARERIEALQQALDVSEAMYRTVMDATLDMIFILDAEGKFEYGNPRIKAITGHRADDWIDQHFSHVVVSQDLPTAHQMFQTVMNGRAVRHELSFYSANGQVMTLDLRLVPRLEDGRVTGATGVGNDITALKRVAELGQRRELEQAGLHAITAAISGTLELDETLNLALETALAVTDANAGSIYLWDEPRQVLRLAAHHNRGPEFVHRVEIYRPGEGITGRAAQGQRPLIIGDVTGLSFPRKGTIEQEGIHTRVSIPLWTRDRLMGVLNLQSQHSTQRFSEMSDWLAAVGHQIAIAIENARLYEVALADSRREALLRHLSMNLGHSLDLDEILNRTMADLGKLAGADRTYFITIDPEAKTWRITHKHVAPGIKPDVTLNGIFDHSRAEVNLILAGQPVVVDDVDTDPLVTTTRATYQSLNMKSFLLVPVTVKGQLYGALSFDYCREKHFWQSEEIELLESVAHQLSLALENILLYVQVRASETRYRTLFESANEGITIETMDGHILDANPRACEMLGYTREEYLRLTEADIVAPEVREQLPERYRQVKERGWLQLESVNLHKDGHLVPVEITANVATLDDQERLFVLTRDITRRKQLEQQLLQAQKMEAIGTLAGGIAHDFNNILVGILGYASLLQQELPDDFSLQSDVETIIRSARRAADLTHQLLALTRHSHLDVRSLNLNDVVAEVIQLLSRTLDKVIVIETHLDDDLAAVEGDAGQLYQVLLNLALNAGDAMPQGGRLIIETANVTLNQEQARADLNLRPGHYACLSVTDTGHGMDETTIDRIFEPFFTTKEEGRGLGLAVVYSIVNAHQATIHIDSEPGVGTAFKIYFPTTADATFTVPPDGRKIIGGTETVLIVDDEESVRYLLKRVLEQSGYTVLLAEDGCLAVELYRQHADEISLVILDMIMPRMGGRETFKQLQGITPLVKVLLSSGYSTNGQAEEILRAGACGFLQKPYDVPGVLHKIREVLDREHESSDDRAPGGTI